MCLLVSKGQTTIEMFESSRSEPSDSSGGLCGVFSCFGCGGKDEARVTPHDTASGSRGMRHAKLCCLKWKQFLHNVKRLFGTDQIWVVFLPRRHVTLYIDELDPAYYQAKTHPNHYLYPLPPSDQEHPSVTHRSGSFNNQVHNSSSYSHIHSANMAESSPRNHAHWMDPRFDQQRDLDV